MTKKEITLLINLFSQNEELVWVTDDQWNILGGKYSYSYQKPIPELLGIPTDCWENTEKKVYLDKHFFDCTVHAVPSQKYRVVVLKTIEAVLSEDPTEIYVFQTLQQAQNLMHEYLDEKEDYDQVFMPKMIEKSLLLLYRKTYLRKMLQSIYDETIEKNSFFIIDIIEKIKLNIQRLLKGYADLQIVYTGENSCLYENMDFFISVVLSGLILCHQKKEFFQHIRLHYKHTGSITEIRTEITCDPEKTVDLSNQPNIAHFSRAEETELLNAFCAIHDGFWKYFEHSGKNGISYCCQITFHVSDAKNDLIMKQHSFKNNNPDIYNIYSLLLSHVYLSFL